MKILDKLVNVRPTVKWWTIAFLQIWIWPSLFDAHMPVGIALSMFITMMICVMYTVNRLIRCYDR